MKEMKELPALKLLLQGYLHIDWPEEYNDPWVAVGDYLTSEPGHARMLRDEILYLLKEIPDERKLREVFVDILGSGYLPESDYWTYEEWLLEVVRRAVLSRDAGI